MAKSKKLDQKSPSNKHHGAKLSSFGCMKSFRDTHHHKKPVDPSEKREWKNALCSVCMEYPHSAVLLLCSSYEKGCRPYMCATGRRFSNCLEQYKKSSLTELFCPLCRGQVKGWTVVKPAREYLNAKKRTCMHENCSFVGNYKNLRRHVKLDHHPSARPRDVDPCRVEKWKELENKRELDDVVSTIMSIMPGATIRGDYVIERGSYSDSSVDSDLYSSLSSSDDEDSGGFDARPAVGSRWRGNGVSSRNSGHSVGFGGARQVSRLRGHLRVIM